MPVPRSCSSRSNGPRPGPQACSTAWPPLACWLFYVPLAVHVSVAENGVWPWPILVILRLGADPSLAGLPAAGPKHRPSCPPPQRCPQKRAQPLLLEMRNGPCSGQLRQAARTRWRGSASPRHRVLQDARSVEGSYPLDEGSTLFSREKTRGYAKPCEMLSIAIRCWKPKGF